MVERLPRPMCLLPFPLIAQRSSLVGMSVHPAPAHSVLSTGGIAALLPSSFGVGPPAAAGSERAHGRGNQPGSHLACAVLCLAAGNRKLFSPAHVTRYRRAPRGLCLALRACHRDPALPLTHDEGSQWVRGKIYQQKAIEPPREIAGETEHKPAYRGAAVGAQRRRQLWGRREVHRLH